MTRAINAVPGVLSESVNLQKDDVLVRYDSKKTSAAAISAAIAKSGYKPHLSK